MPWPLTLPIRSTIFSSRPLDSIGLQFEQKNVVLLHGVTSSGKTEIYIHLIQKTISEGKQVLYLLPEIALTVQMMMRLKRVFGNRLGIYHSKYSDAERVEIWRKQLSAEPYDVILGARSAVFLPFQRLGLVVIDEEHESSYKQQDPAPRYHARSVAIVMAQMLGAKTLLGTATPCIETYHNALLGKYGLVTLSQRYKGVQLPQIELVDIKDLRHRKMMRGPLSPQLLSAMREALTAGEQVILFRTGADLPRCWSAPRAAGRPDARTATSRSPITRPPVSSFATTAATRVPFRRCVLPVASAISSRAASARRR